MLRVAYRSSAAGDGNGGEWGSREEQDRYLRDIREGKREGEGAKKEGVSEGRIVLAEGMEGGQVISSTRVREVIKGGDTVRLAKLVTQGVGKWVLREGLYLKDD